MDRIAIRLNRPRNINGVAAGGSAVGIGVDLLAADRPVDVAICIAKQEVIRSGGADIAVVRLGHQLHAVERQRHCAACVRALHSTEMRCQIKVRKRLAEQIALRNAGNSTVAEVVAGQREPCVAMPCVISARCAAGICGIARTGD